MLVAVNLRMELEHADLLKRPEMNYEHIDQLAKSEVELDPRCEGTS